MWGTIVTALAKFSLTPAGLSPPYKQRQPSTSIKTQTTVKLYAITANPNNNSGTLPLYLQTPLIPSSCANLIPPCPTSAGSLLGKLAVYCQFSNGSLQEGTLSALIKQHIRSELYITSPPASLWPLIPVPLLAEVAIPPGCQQLHLAAFLFPVLLTDMYI